jgi:hypothetical protein
MGAHATGRQTTCPWFPPSLSSSLHTLYDSHIAFVRNVGVSDIYIGTHACCLHMQSYNIASPE